MSDCREFLGLLPRNVRADPSKNHISETTHERVKFLSLKLMPLNPPSRKKIQGILLDLVNIIKLAK